MSTISSDVGFRTLLSAAPDALVVVDEARCIVAVNDAAEELFGYERAEIEGASLRRLVPDAHRAAHDHHVTAYHAAPRRRRMGEGQDLEALRKDGSTFAAEISLRPIEVGDAQLVVAAVRDVSAKRARREKLARSEARYRTLIEFAPDAIIIADPDTGQIRDCNQAAAHLFGREQDALVGAHQTTLHPPEVRDEMAALFAEHAQAVVRSGESGIVREVPVVGAEGETRYADITAAPIQLNGATQLLAFFHDVTEARRQRERLEQSQQRWRGLVERNRDPIIVSVGDEIRYVNPAGARVLGPAEPDELIGQSVYQFKATPEGAARLRARIEQVYRGTANEPLEHPIRRLDGTERIVETYSIPIDFEGAPAAQTIIHDRTEQIEAKERLRRSEARYRTLFETAPEPIVVADPETGQIIDVNAAACHLFGRAREALVGVHQRELHPAELGDATTEAFRGFVAQAREAGVAHVEALPVRRSGREDGLADITGRLTELGGEQVVFAFFQDVTERVRRERELRTQRQRLRDAQQIAHLGHWVWNMQTDVLEWSDEVYRIFGVDPDHFAPTFDRFLEMVPPEDHAAIKQAVESGTYQTEHRLVRPGGEVRIVEERGRVTRWDGNVPAELTGTVLDITERRQIEKQMREAQRIAEFGYWSIVPATGEASWSDELYRMLGYEPGAFEPTLDDCLATVHPDDLPKTKQFIEDILNSDTTRRETLRLLSADGTVRHMESRGARSHVDDAGHVHITGIHFDVTERKRAQAELTQKRELLEALFDAIPVMITMYDPALQDIEVNAEFERVLGWSADDAQKRDLLKACYPDPSIRREVIGFMNRPNEGWRDFKVQTKEGDTVLSAWTNIRLSDDTQVGIGIDLTERKQLERQLRQAQKMETVGTLAGGIAHDFNNILHAVRAYIQLSRGSLEGETSAQKYLGRAEEGLDRAKKLVGQLLTFSRQNGPERREPVTVAAEVREVMDLVRPTLPPDTDLRFHLEEEAQIMGDADQIQQVVMNLATNAAQALAEVRPQARRVLEVSVRTVAIEAALARQHAPLEPGPHVRITVSDTGPGMDPVVRERIFNPFYTTKEVGEGTGLGLSVVHGIVSGHEGAITVYSEPGEGTTFHVYLPARAEPDSSRKEHPVDQTSPATHGGHVLVVDDNPDIVDVEAERLRQMGYAVTACVGPEDAWATFRSAPDAFDAVLTDYAMPGMTGLDLIVMLREQQPDLPAILFSGFSAQIDEDTMRAVGVDAFLHKPVPQADLRRAIAALLQ